MKDKKNSYRWLRLLAGVAAWDYRRGVRGEAGGGGHGAEQGGGGGAHVDSEPSRWSCRRSPLESTAGDYLQYAFLANADLQARYWEWRSAIERIPQDASFPNIAVPFSVLFGGGSMKLWDRLTVGLANDPMTNIPHPEKLRTAGRRDLEDARAAGERFIEAKFLLQGKVLSTLLRPRAARRRRYAYRRRIRRSSSLSRGRPRLAYRREGPRSRTW